MTSHYDGSTLWRCIICGGDFDNEPSIRNHQEIKHLSEIMSAPEELNKVREPLSESIRGRQYPEPYPEQPDYNVPRHSGGLFLKTFLVLIVLSIGYFAGHFWPPVEIFSNYLYIFWDLPLIADFFIFAKQNWLLLAPVAFLVFIATAILIISLRDK